MFWLMSFVLDHYYYKHKYKEGGHFLRISIPAQNPSNQSLLIWMNNDNFLK